MAKREPKGNIIKLMGEEPKKQMKKTHQAIMKAFKGKNTGNGKRPKGRSR